MDKLVSYAISASVLMAGAGVLYNFAVVQPNLEQARMEQAESVRRDAESEKKAAADAVAAAEAKKKDRYQTCLGIVMNVIAGSRAKQCENFAGWRDSDYKNCMEKSANLEFCKSRFPPLDSSPFCALPKEIADSIEKVRKEATQKCLDEAKAGL
jgi:hypothetical protein